ncbi:MAG: hypothetical protein U9N10_06785 [Bacillota bacterium]|nr:hypothetical protein [Bacillota bacterium]
MENSLKMLMIGAAVVITLAVITSGFFILRQGQGILKNSAEKISVISTDIEETEFTMYEDQEVSGSEVVNVVRKYDDERMGVFVRTGKDSSGEWYINNISGISSNDYIGEITTVGENISKMIDESNNEYVNPNGKFLGKVIRNENDSIIGLYFVQQ